MFDVIVRGLDRTHHQHHAVRQRLLAESFDFVGMAGVRKRQYQRARMGLVEHRQYIRAGHVVIVRAIAVAPAGMQPHFLPWDTFERFVKGRHVHLDRLDEI